MGMTEKELKKLSRRQLLELLLEQTERADQLQAKLDEAERRLRDRTLTESEAGSIAEAALRLNGVFESAEAAAAQYIENVKKLSENQALFNERAEAESRKKAEALLSETEERCRAREAESEKRREEITEKLRQMYEQKQRLDELFSGFGGEVT